VLHGCEAVRTGARAPGGLRLSGQLLRFMSVTCLANKAWQAHHQKAHSSQQGQYRCKSCSCLCNVHDWWKAELDAMLAVMGGLKHGCEAVRTGARAPGELKLAGQLLHWLGCMLSQQGMQAH
jgi:hypothetical protein